jgi:glycosyltransferase involved in cell wall biosynthesis
VIPAIASPFSRFRSDLVAYMNARGLKRYPQRSAPFSPVSFSYGRLDRTLIDQADVVCVHWIAGAFLKPQDLAMIGRPLVWRLSDLWPFTGGCHFPGGCDRFADACGRCPILHSAETNDPSARGYLSRQTAYGSLDLTIVAPSRWIAEKARRSSLFRNRRIEHIATGVDLTVFMPYPRADARAALGLPTDERIILFGAFGGTGDGRKGFNDLRVALERLANDARFHDVIVVTFGGRPQAESNVPLPFRTIEVGRIDDERRLSLLYSAVDVLAAPSKEDNLPNVVLEALGCGTPVVAFQIGGIPDAIDHDRNGWLASPGDRDGLAAGLASILEKNDRIGLRAAARGAAERRFDLSRCVGRYRMLFEDIASRAVPAIGLRP